MSYIQNLPAERDWKLFRKKLPDWQENVMRRLNQEYMEILSQDNKASSDIFWELEERIRQDKKRTGVLARDVKRSNMLSLLFDLLSEKAITMDDLSDFSEDLQEQMKWLMERW